FEIMGGRPVTIRLLDPPLHEFLPHGEAEIAEVAAAMGADAVLLLTAWPVYHNPDYAALRAAMRQPVIIDGRNVFEPEMMEQAGFVYYGVGRGRA
ncbi:MAG: UDP binding domain-containing protein, partial [Moraxellaceae bacterium]|nr:UDP binding domain-containing protein [Moraxellaceae bacterium]